MPKHKYIATPEIMEKFWNEYKAHVKSNPRIIYQLDKIGNLVPVPHECPYILVDFYEFVCNHPETQFDTDSPDLSDYFENKDNRYSEYIRITTRIKRGCQSDQITGGMTGQYNANLTARITGVTDNVDVTSKGESVSEIKVNIITSNKGE